MKPQTCETLRWTLRTTLMFFVGVVPAILLFLFILVMMPLAGILADLVTWLAVFAVFALLGIAGLWTATFRDQQERILPNAVTIVLVLCGLLVAAPPLISTTMQSLEDEAFSLWPIAGLIGPVACAIYFLIEQLVIALGRRRAAHS